MKKALCILFLILQVVLVAGAIALQIAFRYSMTINRYAIAKNRIWETILPSDSLSILLWILAAIALAFFLLQGRRAHKNSCRPFACYIGVAFSLGIILFALLCQNYPGFYFIAPIFVLLVLFQALQVLLRRSGYRAWSKAASAVCRCRLFVPESPPSPLPASITCLKNMSALFKF